MDHISYRLYNDLIIPLSEFLKRIRFFKFHYRSPKVPTNLY